MSQLTTPTEPQLTTLTEPLLTSSTEPLLTSSTEPLLTSSTESTLTSSTNESQPTPSNESSLHLQPSTLTSSIETTTALLETTHLTPPIEPASNEPVTNLRTQLSELSLAEDEQLPIITSFFTLVPSEQLQGNSSQQTFEPIITSVFSIPHLQDFTNHQTTTSHRSFM